jgi:hypothetical protein
LPPARAKGAVTRDSPASAHRSLSYAGQSILQTAQARHPLESPSHRRGRQGDLTARKTGQI